MTRDDIIRMAREAGIVSPEQTGEVWCAGEFQLHEFAALVAAAEREKVRHELLTLEKWKGLALAKGGDGRTAQQVEAEARAAEREECAKVVEELLADTRYEKIPQEARISFVKALDAIRARGKE